MGMVGVRRGSVPRVPGTVLQVARGRAVVLADGRFLRMRAMPGWGPGEEVWIAQAEPTPLSRPWRLRLAAVAAVAVTAGGGLAWTAVASAQVAAVVSLDINPSVELNAGANGEVLRAKPLDPDGARLLAATTVRGLPLNQAIARLVTEAVVQGYLPSASSASDQATGLVLVSVAPTRGAEVPSVVQAQVRQGQQQAQGILAKRDVPAQIDLVQAGAKTQQAAARAGLSTGAYVVAEETNDAGVDAPMSTFRGQPLGKALTKVGIPAQDVAPVVQAATIEQNMASDDTVSAKAKAVIQEASKGASDQSLQALLHQAMAAADARGKEKGKAAQAAGRDGGDKAGAQRSSQSASDGAANAKGSSAALAQASATLTIPRGKERGGGHGSSQGGVGIALSGTLAAGSGGTKDGGDQPSAKGKGGGDKPDAKSGGHGQTRGQGLSGLLSGLRRGKG